MTDPRPYNYEFRRPRLDNRTYHSNHTYQSIYHNSKHEPIVYPNSNVLKDQYNYRQNLYNPHQSNINNSQKNGYQGSRARISSKMEIGINTDNGKKVNAQVDRYSSSKSNRSELSKSSNLNNNSGVMNHRASILSTYGTTTLPKESQVQNNSAIINHQKDHLAFSNREVNTIYKGQQHPYDIINCYPRNRQQIIREHPKFTLETRFLNDKWAQE